ncbi:sensor histidine kinase [Oligoflexus tunisiensis]|uniref:sensor histidine kinase n=1 Tax=Oligoflexus tunisiensis TaxID=708132 RepID=UPI00114CF6F6|nr:ATP-binding protein [Oligoflexus tunisiensis]
MAEKRKYSRSLQRRLVITILLASSVLTTVFTAISFYMDYREEMNSLESTFESLGHSSVDNIAESLYDFNHPGVMTQIRGITGIRDITKVVVIDEDGKVYAEAKGDVDKSAVVSYIGLERFFEDKRTAKVYPLMNPRMPQQMIGSVSVEASQRNMFVRLSNKAIYFFLTQGLKTLIVSLIMIEIFRVLVTQHLKRIVDFLALYDFQAKEAGEPLTLKRHPPRRPDELDSMVDTVNTLSQRLHQFNAAMQQQFYRKDQEVRDQRAIASNVVKLAMLGEMAGGVAHEINNPLHIIKGYNDILVDQLGQGVMDREVLHRASLVIDRNTNRIARIVSSLLMFSRRGDQEFFELISLSQLIAQVVSITQPLAENHGIHFEVELDALHDVPPVACQQSQIAQVLINIINNAIDAIMDQEHSDPWIRVTGRVVVDQVQIEVIDCGAGIPDAVAAKMFEPFYTTKEVGKGTGLGLSLSLGIIEQHGGRLYLDKQKPHTCFVVELPLSQEKAQRAS